ncbi:MAG: DNA polymerase III subunit delta' [Candidatus Scalindua sp.]|nr:DNA polymerase III subunit delta' [Candidatus Scalindua sp.]MBT6231423.1 DNA polymerase III subunit delta' [Candidatus Scalindua sp.]MBT6563051.1 DNA polymerase III subunit delta' [Candidatus Scalindua sp.]MBT7210336.1 DNA polymerase III subunit delta' [Candidatus Scalindua sp.]
MYNQTPPVTDNADGSYLTISNQKTKFIQTLAHKADLPATIIMPLNDILAQDHIIDHFKKAIKADRLSHAYIFAGQDGVGKTLFAKEFTKSLFCENDKNDCCNLCPNCIRIEKNCHPDVFYTGREAKAKFIKIEDIRNLQHSVRFSPLESDYKVFIIKDADRMNEEASNCLLKTLEEPSPHTIFILIANSITPVKETIRSRCQIIRFHPIPTHIIEEQLTSKYESADPIKIGWASRFCNGSLGNAPDLLDNNYYEMNNDIVTRMIEPDMDNLFLAEYIIDSYLSTEDSLEEKRETLKSILNCILQFYRDLLIVKIRNVQNDQLNKIFLLNEDRETILQRYVNYLTQEQIINVIDEILTSFKYIDFNLNINLLVENIITTITVLNSKARQ